MGGVGAPQTGVAQLGGEATEAMCLSRGGQTFTLSFDAIATDGVRIYGTPGGIDAFTNIAELSVHYEL